MRIIKTIIKNKITAFCKEIFRNFFIFVFLEEFFQEDNIIM